MLEHYKHYIVSFSSYIFGKYIHVLWSTIQMNIENQSLYYR